MNDYLNSLNNEIKQYYKILCSTFPEWLTDYSKFFNVKYWYSNLDHSIGVALIIWNFTHDKKQTIAGLLHDIATPAFKHCIDFMNGD